MVLLPNEWFAGTTGTAGWEAIIANGLVERNGLRRRWKEMLISDRSVCGLLSKSYTKGGRTDR